MTDVARFGKVAGFSADGEQLTEWAQVRSNGSTDRIQAIGDGVITRFQWIGPSGVATLPIGDLAHEFVELEDED